MKHVISLCLLATAVGCSKSEDPGESAGKATEAPSDAEHFGETFPIAMKVSKCKRDCCTVTCRSHLVSDRKHRAAVVGEVDRYEVRMRGADVEFRVASANKTGTVELCTHFYSGATEVVAHDVTTASGGSALVAPGSGFGSNCHDVRWRNEPSGDISITVTGLGQEITIDVVEFLAEQGLSAFVGPS